VGLAGGEPRQVPAEALSETVVFEILDPIRAKRLAELLHPHRRIRFCEVGGAALVFAELRPREGDLAALLREVSAWLKESERSFVRFYVDGRAYVLGPGPSIYPAPGTTGD
jgi:hypothetical protein